MGYRHYLGSFRKDRYEELNASIERLGEIIDEEFEEEYTLFNVYDDFVKEIVCMGKLYFEYDEYDDLFKMLREKACKVVYDADTTMYIFEGTEILQLLSKYFQTKWVEYLQSDECDLEKMKRSEIFNHEIGGEHPLFNDQFNYLAHTFYDIYTCFDCEDLMFCVYGY